MLRAVRLPGGNEVFHPTGDRCALRARFDGQTGHLDDNLHFRVAVRVDEGYRGVSVWFWAPPRYTVNNPSDEDQDEVLATVRFYRDEQSSYWIYEPGSEGCSQPQGIYLA